MRKKLIFQLVFICLLAACAPATPSATPTPTIDVTAAYKDTLATAVMRITQTAAPSATPTLKPGELAFFSMQGYQAIFADGDSLYLQNGEDVPVLLSKAEGNGLFRERMLSSDREKIAFLHGKTPKSTSANADVFTVNAHGTAEQLLIPPQWLTTLIKGTGRGAALPAFIPGTHQMIFETSLCQSPDKDAPCSTGVFLADPDTAQVTPVLSPGTAQPPSLWDPFAVSPDGKLIATGSAGHVDIFDTEGVLVRGGAFVYTPSTSTTLFPALFWLPDSSALIASLPTNSFHISANDQDVASYAIWRYTISDSHADLIPLDPSPMNLLGEADRFRISPDGNWLLYGGNGPYASDLYLANLRDGHVQRIGDNPQPGFSWSPDSKRFFGDNFTGILGERVAQVNKNAIAIVRWIDATHFICRFCAENNAKPHIAEITGDTFRFYRLPPAWEEDAYLLIVPK